MVLQFSRPMTNLTSSAARKNKLMPLSAAVFGRHLHGTVVEVGISFCAPKTDYDALSSASGCGSCCGRGPPCDWIRPHGTPGKFAQNYREQSSEDETSLKSKMCGSGRWNS